MIGGKQKELGAQILTILSRNAALFRWLATATPGTEDEDPPPTLGYPSGLSSAIVAASAAGSCRGNAAQSASKSVAATEVTAPPTPPSRVGVIAEGVIGEGAEGGGGGGESLLRRLCLDAVTVGEHASFGEVGFSFGGGGTHASCVVILLIRAISSGQSLFPTVSCVSK